jgi:hypothetical protein
VEAAQRRRGRVPGAGQAAAQVAGQPVGEQGDQGQAEAEQPRDERPQRGSGQMQRRVGRGRARLARPLQHGGRVRRPVGEVVAGLLDGLGQPGDQADGQGRGQQQDRRGDLGGVHVRVAGGRLVGPARRRA